MSLPFVKNLRPGAIAASALACASLAFTGCSDSPTRNFNEPAPQTLNGIVMALYAGGPTYTFVAASGDPTTGTEFGAFTMNLTPTGFPAVTAGGVSFTAPIVDSVTGGAYEYRRTAAESGEIRITGLGIFPPPAPGDPPRYLAGPFDHSYDVLFGTSGQTISGLNIADIDNAGGPYTNLVFVNGYMQLFGGGAVPVGWTLERSRLLDLPTVYPNTITGKRFIFTPADPLQEPLNIYFLTSTFTRFLDEEKKVLAEERGVGRYEITETEDVTINYSYRPVADTVDQTALDIAGSSINFSLNLNFTDFQAGNYTAADGSSGTFTLRDDTIGG